jgi:hypothetical protein
MNDLDWNRKYQKLLNIHKIEKNKLVLRKEQQRRDNAFKEELKRRYPNVYDELANYFSKINNNRILQKEKGV